ncbi:PTS glucose transporter subunit IIA [Mycoplasma sp. Pen4]|uniref:PTS glucose transporter subunit IIA n=1 Tax=Mycoplasma sp. Pen4 TaxID=640330 RepID=UPI00165454D3|nr:PTS glucose transporter subunit IIA [Mycoplasma sp. Pen4]QNM93712.1 PTS glucose transporter subunit IIA [Mycoplasma sp. Pen4]
MSKCAINDTKGLVKVVEAFGGVKNILSYNNSVSELRYDVRDLSLVNIEGLKEAGAKDVKIFDAARHVQVKFDDAEELNKLIKCQKEELASLCRVQTSDSTNESNAEKCEKVSPVSELVALAPVNGEVVSFDKINDGIFSNRLIGNGFAIAFDANAKTVEVVAPFDAKITMLPANKTQIIFSNVESGVEAMMLFGLNSYKLDGIGFESFVTLNQTVKAGDKLFELDLTRFTNENVDKHLFFALTADSSMQNIDELQTNANVGKHLFTIK